MVNPTKSTFFSIYRSFGTIPPSPAIAAHGVGTGPALYITPVFSLGLKTLRRRSFNHLYLTACMIPVSAFPQGREVDYSNGFITTIPGILVKSFLFSVTMLVIPFSFMVSEMRTSKNGDLND